MTVRWELVTGDLRFPEGPVAMADGSVILVEIAAERVTRVAPDGTKTHVADVKGGPNGAAIGPGGALYICNNGGRFRFHEREGLLVAGHPPPEHAGGSIQRLDLATGALETLLTECEGRRVQAPNDLVFETGGGFWFTDHGRGDAETMILGGLFHAGADGRGARRAVPTMVTPNGVGLSPDGRTVYMAGTLQGRLYGWEIAGPGEVAPFWRPPVTGQALHGGLFDSLAVEADGRIAVGTLVPGGITVIDPRDGSAEFVEGPPGDPLITNIAFGGADMRDAWITASGTGGLYRARWPRPGLRLAFNA